MSGALSKRQQARNERTLQELIKTVPGNNVCADCQARNPGWASWSLGIFLCMRCAALHRKLGTHITKVKSLSMDSWSNDQVENMKRIGNVASNRIYNPHNTRPPIPFDADEADSSMERFIRQKYQDRAAEAQMRHNTGSTNSDDQPPPLPPKTGSRFGFRSASSIFPLSSKSRREQAARAEFESGERSPSPHRRNKQSRVFGTEIGSDGTDDLDTKLAKLRDMGFRDEKRNLTVLKGLQGNLEKSIETLVRLGEGSNAARPGDNFGPSSGSRTPLSPGAGITIDRTRERNPPKSSNNPFDMLDAPPTPVKPQSSQSTGSMGQPQNLAMGSNQYQQPPNTNPFGFMPSQSQYSLNQAFQNMAVSSSQPLFPHHTGGFPAPPQPQQLQLYQQSMTPPVPSVPQKYYPPVIYENAAQQPQQNYNPFMQQQQQAPQPPQINTSFQSNPYGQQLSAPVMPSRNFFNSPLEQSPMQQQHPQSFYDNGIQQQPQQPQQSNPYLQNNAQQQMPQQAVQQMPQQMPQQLPQQLPQQIPQQTSQQMQQQMPQQSYNYQSQQQPQYQQYRQNTMPLMSQQTGHADKRSILDLYNYPQLAPTPLQQQQNQHQGQDTLPLATAESQPPPRVVSNPVAAPTAGSRNPFMASGGGGVPSTGGDAVRTMGQFPPQMGARHVSQESMSVDTGGWNGRHSPDAWGTISSRSAR